MCFLSSTPKRKHLSNFQKSLTRQGCRAGSSCSGQCAYPLVLSSLRWTSNHWLACLGTTLSSMLLLTLCSLALCWHQPLLHQEWKSADPSAAVWHGSSANWDVHLVTQGQAAQTALDSGSHHREAIYGEQHLAQDWTFFVCCCCFLDHSCWRKLKPQNLREQIKDSNCRLSETLAFMSSLPHSVLTKKHQMSKNERKHEHVSDDPGQSPQHLFIVR